MPSHSPEPTNASLELLEDRQIEVVSEHLIPSLVRVQEVSAVVYRIQLCRHIWICQPSVEVEHCIEGP